MRIRFIWPGKTKDEHLRELIAEYLKRLTRFVRCEVIETREGPGPNRAGVEKESRRILVAIPTGSLAVLLDVKGREWSSPELADEVSRWENDAVQEGAAGVGGSAGIRHGPSASAHRRVGQSRATPNDEIQPVVGVR